MPPEAIAAATVVTLVAGGIAIIEFTLKPIRRYVFRHRDPPAATPEDLERLKHDIFEYFNHWRGVPAAATEELVRAASPDRLDILEAATIAERAGHHEEAAQLLSRLEQQPASPRARAALHILIGNSFLSVPRLAEAEDHYRQVLTYAEESGDQEAQAEALGNLGLVYRDRGGLEKAEEHHRKALAIHEEVGNRLGQAKQLNNLGNVYVDRGDLDKAGEHHKEALAMHEEIGDKLGQARGLGNLGCVYQRRGDLNKADESLRNALATYAQIDDRLGQAAALGNLGNVYLDRGNLEEAEEHYRNALAMEQEIGNKLGQANQMANLGLVAQQRGDTGKARDVLQNAAHLYKEIGAGGIGPEIVREALQRLGAPPAEE